MRRTIDGSTRPAVVNGMRTRNNGRYNGNGREWGTPLEVFAPLDEEFDFTIDVCATAANAKCKHYWTEADDGLSKSWVGQRAFMNPPYGREVAAWAKKAYEETQDECPLVVGLLPASTDLAWWHEYVVGKTQVRYLRGRPRFITGGPYRASAFQPSVIVIWCGVGPLDLSRMADFPRCLR